MKEFKTIGYLIETEAHPVSPTQEWSPSKKGGRVVDGPRVICQEGNQWRPVTVCTNHVGSSITPQLRRVLEGK